MALPQTWPVTLPDNFSQNGYSEGNIENYYETTMEQGPPKRRPKTTYAYKPITGTMLITSAQKADFQDFFTDTIGYGSLPFTMPTYGGTTMDVYLNSHSIVPKSGLYWTLTLNLKVLV